MLLLELQSPALTTTVNPMKIRFFQKILKNLEIKRKITTTLTSTQAMLT